MAASNPSRVGQNNLSGASDALFLDVFGGEVLTAFETEVKLKDKIRSRTLTEGKSARFPVMYRAVGNYHTPGAEILGQNIAQSEVVVTLDDMLYADAFIAQIDELKNHYDARAPISTQLGRALALIYDRMVSMSILASARSAAPITGDDGGGKIIQTDIAAGANFLTSGSDLFKAMGRAYQKLDEKDVPVDSETVWGAVQPAQFYLMAQDNYNINRDLQGQGNVGDNVLRTTFGVNIIKSNALLFGKDVTPYNASTNTDGLVGKPGTARDVLPANFPSKYQADLSGATATVALVWTQDAAAMLNALAPTMDVNWDPRRLGTLITARMACGSGKLRPKCAMEIALT